MNNKPQKMTANELACRIFAHFPKRIKRTAWDRGCNAYGDDLLSTFGNTTTESREWTYCALRDALMQGEDSWWDYSAKGYALTDNYDIAKRLCTPGELKKSRNGELPPKRRKSWLELQADALSQAAQDICRIALDNRLVTFE